jgi:hypothetical protein
MNASAIFARLSLRKESRIAIAIFAIVLILCITFGRYATVRAFSGGTGTIADPYIITTCADLQAIDDDSENMHMNFKLGNDIDCTGVTYQPIGVGDGASFDTGYMTFTGRFDGAGHTISHVTTGNSTYNIAGIFGVLGGAYIHNLTIDQASTTGKSTTTGVGILAGAADQTAIIGVTLTNSHKRGVAVSGNPSGDPFNGSFLVGAFSTPTTFSFVYDPASYTEPSEVQTSIGSCSALASAIRANPHGWYSLSADINCAGIFPLATSTSAFRGIFDGNGHTVSGISTTTSTYPIGLFARAFGATIRNVSLTGTGITLVNVNPEGVGALVGAGTALTLSNVHSTVPLTMAANNNWLTRKLGGLVGAGGSIGIDTSSVNADMGSGYGAYMGGLIGNAYDVEISSSTYIGNLNAEALVGGIVGYTLVANLNNVHATTTISCAFECGGLAGQIDNQTVQYQFANASSTITDSSARVTFNDANNAFTEDTRAEWIGGLIGWAENVNLRNVTANVDASFSSPTTLELDEIGGLAGRFGRYYRGTTVTNVTNATSTFSLVFDSSGGVLYGAGGLIGTLFANAPASFTNAYASTTIVAGTPIDTVDDVSYLGGIGGDPGEVALQNVSSKYVISVYGDPSSAAGVHDIGGVSGERYLYSNTTDSSAIGTINITGSNIFRIAGFDGYLDSSLFQNSYASSTITINGQPQYIGGLFGYLADSVIQNSYAISSIAATVAGNLSDIGGLAGFSSQASFDSSFVQGSIVATGNGSTPTGAYRIGGAFGDLLTSTSTNTYASTTISLDTPVPENGNESTAVGGFVGDLSSSVLSNSYAAGSLTLASASSSLAFLRASGFIGRSDGTGSAINNSFAGSRVTLSASTSEIGAFAGEPNIGDAYTTNAYAADLTPGLLCTGQDLTDPAWCAPRTPTSYFFTSTNQPLAVWDFSTVWDTNGCDFPILNVFSSFFPNAGTSCSGGGGGNTAPTLTTSSASAITDTGATLNGTITAIGSPAPTVRGFAYGLTTAYGATTAQNGSFGTGAYTAIVSGLSCNTTYHVASYATNLGGTGYGADVPFTTSACSAPTPASASHHSSSGPITPPGLVITNITSSLTSSGVTVTWDTNEPASSQLFYGSTISLGATTPETDTVSGVTSHTVMLPLPACDHSQHFSVLSTDAAGKTSVSPGHSSTTLVCPAVPPASAPGAVMPPPSFGTGSVKAPTPPIAPPTIAAAPPHVPPDTGQAVPSPVAPTANGTFLGLLKVMTEAPLALLQFVSRGSSSLLLSLLAAFGLLIAALGILWNFASSLRTLSDIPSMLARGFGSLFPFGYFRRKDRPWGTVYDSYTLRPLDPAVVTLYDASGKELKTIITDLDGRFGFLADAGTYSVIAQKGHHSFPARNIAVLDPVYTHPYTGGPITITNEGVVVKDIPLDPVDFDWNEYEKYRKGLFHFFSRFDRPLAYASLILTPLGALISIVEMFVQPNFFNILFVLLYALIGFLYLSGFRPRLYGMVKDALGQPLAFAVVKAYRPGATSTSTKAVTDHLGRYYLLLPPGDTYDITVESRSGDTFTPVYRAHFEHLEGHLGRVIRV